MNRLAKGAMESEIATAVTRFHREQHGKGPTEVRAHIIGDLIAVRCRGALTPTEVKLSRTDAGCKLVKSARQELRAINHKEIEDIVAALAGCPVLRSYFDLDVSSGQQVEVYELQDNLEKLLRPG